MESRRLDWVDYAKGIGIILVVYGHVLRGLHSANMNIDPAFFNAVDKIIYSFHMPLFFLLSGLFVEKWLAKDTKKGIIEKIKALIIPYAAWSLIQGTVNLVMSSLTNSHMSLTELISIPVKPFGQFWFVYFLFFFFIVYLLCRKILSIKLTLLLFSVMYIISYFFELQYHLEIISNYIVFFGLGSVFAKFTTNLSKTKFTNNTYFYPGISLGIFIASSVLSLYASNIVLSILSAVSGVSFVIIASMLLAKRNQLKFLKELGTASMAIYLMHILFASGSRIIFSRIFGIENVIAHMLIGTILGIVIPYLFYRVVRDYQLSSILFGVKSNRNIIHDDVMRKIGTAKSN